MSVTACLSYTYNRYSLSQAESRYKRLGILDRSASCTLYDVIDEEHESDLAVLLLEPARIDNHALRCSPESILRLRECRLGRVDSRLGWSLRKVRSLLAVLPCADDIIDLHILIEIEPYSLKVSEHDRDTDCVCIYIGID